MTVEIKDIAKAADEMTEMVNELNSHHNPYGRSFQQHTNMMNDIDEANQKYDDLCKQYINQKLRAHLATRDMPKIENIEDLT